MHSSLPTQVKKEKWEMTFIGWEIIDVSNEAVEEEVLDMRIS